MQPPTCDDRPLWDLWLSFHHAPVLCLADEVGLFPFLAREPRTQEEVAEVLAFSKRGTEAVLGILTSLGLLSHHLDRFHLTDLSRNYLLPENPFYWGGMLHRLRAHPATEAIRAALQSDIDRERITDAWERGQVDPERVRAFTRAMHSHSYPAATGVARHGDFTGVRRLLDVGGGSGCFCIALAHRYPDLHGTVMDLPEVCDLAREYATAAGVADRIDTLSADMFRDPWPTGYDALFFSNIFHDWDPERCRELACKAYAVLPPGGTIYLHEMLLADTKSGPLPAASFSLSMVLNTRGKQYSAAELDEMLRAADFHKVTVTPTYGYYSLLSAEK